MFCLEPGTYIQGLSRPWSSLGLDKEPLGVTGLPDNFPIHQKGRLFLKGNLLILSSKTVQLIVEWGSYLFN